MSHWGKAASIIYAVLQAVALVFLMHVDTIVGALLLGVNLVCYLVSILIIVGLETRRTVARLTRLTREFDEWYQDVRRDFVSPRQLGERMIYRDERYLP